MAVVSGEWPEATVCFLRREGKVLLQERAAGRIWAGRLNGPGGKIAAGETPLDAVVREVTEETGVRIADPVFAGNLDLHFGMPESSRLRVHIFVATTYQGRMRGGPEGRLRWFGEHRLPFDRLWPDMRYWLPAVLDGGQVHGECVYDAEGDALLASTLRIEITP